MKPIYICLIACCMFFAATVAYSQQPGSNGRDKIAVCHKGAVIWVSSAALPAHLAHGDQLAVLNAAGQYVCPCKPDGQPPVTYCPDGTPQTWYWDVTYCKWIPKDCPQCQPTQPEPQPRVCPDGTLAYWYWDFTVCKWIPKDCPSCQPTTPEPTPRQCPDGSFAKWIWDTTLCQWVPTNCPCNTVNNPPPPCPVPGVNCCWLPTADCKWILVDCTTLKPYPCGTIFNGILLNCDCTNTAGSYISCP